MQPLEFVDNPLRLSLARRVRDDSHFISVLVDSSQRIFGNIGWFFVVADHLPGDAQDSPGGAIVQSERPQQILVSRGRA